MADLPVDGTSIHKDCSPSRIARCEKSVQEVQETIASWVDPFAEGTESDDLLNISSGVVAPPNVKKDLMHARTVGEEEFQKFVENRLKTSNVGFFEPLSKLKLETFSTVLRKKIVKVKGKDIVVRADRHLMARMLVVAQSRKMDLQEVLTHELGPVPWSIACVDGSLVKTAKSTLLAVLENDLPAVDHVQRNAAWMVDAMAVLQSLTVAPGTFADLALSVFTIVTAPFANGARRVDFVVDQYPRVSIKACERGRRATQGVLRVEITHRQQKCPTQWKKFLSVNSNKVGVAAFLAKEWAMPDFAPRLHGRSLYVTYGNACSLLTSADGQVVDVTPVEDLRCNHEEADTRLILHARHACENGERAIVIRSPDTDVAILAVFHFPQLQLAARGECVQVFFRTGTKHRLRYIDIDALSTRPDRTVSGALSGLHALTGCDSTSAFKRRGKKSALDLLKSRHGQDFCIGLADLGKHFSVSETLHKLCEKFVCLLYRSGTLIEEVNKLRHQLFVTRATQSDQMPPTQDALRQHVLRANYQAGVWQRALEREPAIPGPAGHGWSLTSDQELSIAWMTKAPAPDNLLLLISCQCQTGCDSGRCSCVHAGLRCTDACRCDNCTCSNKDRPDVEDDGINFANHDSGGSDEEEGDGGDA